MDYVRDGVAIIDLLASTRKLDTRKEDDWKGLLRHGHRTDDAALW